MALFVNKQLLWWSASITLDNNNGVLTDFYPFYVLYTLPHTSVGLTGCISTAFSVLNFLTYLTTILIFSISSRWGLHWICKGLSSVHEAF